MSNAVIYNNNSNTTIFTTNAQSIISNIVSNYIIFIKEDYSWGDSDAYGPYEHFWTLYIGIQNEAGEDILLKYTREVYEKEGQKNCQVDYEHAELNTKDIFSDILQSIINEEADNYPEPPEPGYEHYDHYDYSETTPANMTEQAQATLESFKKEVDEEIIFTGEFNEGYDFDKEGPREYYWMLYIFTRVDGEVKKYKFSRETNYHDEADETVVPYERAIMYKDDSEKIFYY
jgi:hypothetical protein